MRHSILLFLIASLLIGGASSCSTDEIIIVQNAIPNADVVWDFWGGPSYVEIDGEIFNEGNTFIRSIELEFRMYDEYGRWIDNDFVHFDVFLNPGEFDLFSVDFRIRYVYDVDVVVRNIY